ncbi:unnamed protein product [Lampetra fluviatilis]
MGFRVEVPRGWAPPRSERICWSALDALKPFRERTAPHFFSRLRVGLPVKLRELLGSVGALASEIKPESETEAESDGLNTAEQL